MIFRSTNHKTSTALCPAERRNNDINVKYLAEISGQNFGLLGRTTRVNGRNQISENRSLARVPARWTAVRVTPLLLTLLLISMDAYAATSRTLNKHRIIRFEGAYGSLFEIGNQSCVLTFLPNIAPGDRRVSAGQEFQAFVTGARQPLKLVLHAFMPSAGLALLRPKYAEEQFPPKTILDQLTPTYHRLWLPPKPSNGHWRSDLSAQYRADKKVYLQTEDWLGPFNWRSTGAFSGILSPRTDGPADVPRTAAGAAVKEAYGAPVGLFLPTVDGRDLVISPALLSALVRLVITNPTALNPSGRVSSAWFAQHLVQGPAAQNGTSNRPILYHDRGRLAPILDVLGVAQHAHAIPVPVHHLRTADFQIGNITQAEWPQLHNYLPADAPVSLKMGCQYIDLPQWDPHLLGMHFLAKWGLETDTSFPLSWKERQAISRYREGSLLQQEGIFAANGVEIMKNSKLTEALGLHEGDAIVALSTRSSAGVTTAWHTVDSPALDGGLAGLLHGLGKDTEISFAVLRTAAGKHPYIIPTAATAMNELPQRPSLTEIIGLR